MSDGSRIDVRLADVSAALLPTDVAVVCAREDGLCLGRAALPATAEAVLAGLWAESVQLMREDATGGYEPISPLSDVGNVTPLHQPGQTPRLVLVLGVGAADVHSSRRAGGAAGRYLGTLPEWDVSEHQAVQVSCHVDGMSSPATAAFAEGLILGSYSFAATPSGSAQSGSAQSGSAQSRRASTASSPLAVVHLHGTDQLIGRGRGSRAASAASEASAVGPDLKSAWEFAQGATWARELTNTRTNTKTPAWLGAQAERVLTPLGVKVTVRDENWLSRQGFGGVLAVGSGSVSPPRLIETAWRPRRAASEEHIVLVGKGICFDSGGYNLKPGDSMTAMYTDMAGAAAVLGAVRIIAALKLPIRVTALAPAAENSVSGTAMRTGDVLRHYNGRTTEVTNTDAEGRLVLADALAYATATMDPSVIVDIATLTGAMKLALGARTAGLLATDDDVAAELEAAAVEVDEPVWRMPLEREYDSTLQSPIADAINSAGAPGGITAALFLRHFVGEIPWAHLDIAGPGRSDSDFGYVTKGATGFGARLLAKWIAGRAQ